MFRNGKWEEEEEVPTPKLRLEGIAGRGVITQLVHDMQMGGSLTIDGSVGGYCVSLMSGGASESMVMLVCERHEDGFFADA